jgi:hypothetical protein
MNIKTLKKEKENLSATFSNAPDLDFQYKRWDIIVSKKK